VFPLWYRYLRYKDVSDLLLMVREDKTVWFAMMHLLANVSKRARTATRSEMAFLMAENQDQRDEGGVGNPYRRQYIELVYK